MKPEFVYMARLDGKNLLDTAYAHPRGAMVNFLYSYPGIIMKGNATNDEVRAVFLEYVNVAPQLIQIVSYELNRAIVHNPENCVLAPPGE